MGFANYLIHIVDAVDGVFDALADRLFHILGARARIEHLDFHLVGLDPWEGFPIENWRGEQAADDKADHHEVGGRGMAREITDHRGAVPPAASSLSRASTAASGLGASFIPAIAGIRSETTSRVPDRRPCL